MMHEKNERKLFLDKAISIQNEFASKIQLCGCNEQAVKTVAGVDMAYWKKQEKEYAVCCIVVLDKQTKQVIETKHAFGEVHVPYMAGCLAFRELPLVLETTKKLETIPDLYMFDGNGYLHPRHMGIATLARSCSRQPPACLTGS